MSLSASITLAVNENPDIQTGSFLTKHTVGIATEGTSMGGHKFEIPYRIQGPAIIKIIANSSANDTDISAGFDGVLENA